MRKTFIMNYCNARTILTLALLVLICFTSVFGNNKVKVDPNSNQLQDLIDNAKQNSIITIPKSVYTKPIEIRKPLILKGTSAEDCVLDVMSESPAIVINTRGKVTLENITIKWQRLTVERSVKYDASLVIANTQTKLSNCWFLAKETGNRCKSAIEILGDSNVIVDRCRTNGFEIAPFSRTVIVEDLKLHFSVKMGLKVSSQIVFFFDQSVVVYQSGHCQKPISKVV